MRCDENSSRAPTGPKSGEKGAVKFMKMEHQKEKNPRCVKNAMEEDFFYIENDLMKDLARFSKAARDDEKAKKKRTFFQLDCRHTYTHFLFAEFIFHRLRFVFDFRTWMENFLHFSFLLEIFPN